MKVTLPEIPFVGMTVHVMVDCRRNYSREFLIHLVFIDFSPGTLCFSGCFVVEIDYVDPIRLTIHVFPCNLGDVVNWKPHHGAFSLFQVIGNPIK